ncbi:hypothetical protein QUF70_13310 [Desulfobacterales bacterium HSG17]|nr:hypothetical protein [Desulfobacterales bacterium HSG17]
MNTKLEDESWVWIVMQRIRAKEEIVGQHYEKEDISFIPAFLNKEDAEKSYKKMALAPEIPTEIQAIRYKHLKDEASQNGFLIFIINEAGEIIDKISPDL